MFVYLILSLICSKFNKGIYQIYQFMFPPPLLELKFLPKLEQLINL